MVQSTPSSVFYVNPATGNDNGTGSQASPYRTITQALRQSSFGSIVRLAPGTYNINSGEVFPLLIPDGVVVIGNEVNQGNGFVIEGSGTYNSPTFNRQNVTISPGNNAQLRGVTVTNRATQGTGVWIEATNPTLTNNTFANCGREGVLATGNALPEISNSIFQGNTSSGISMISNAKGVIQQNVCQNTGYGIAIGDSAAPLVIGNQVRSNQFGIVISGSARPVLRNNRLEQNANEGLVVMNNAVPDLGRSQDPGSNVFQGNGSNDLRNATPVSLLLVGNQINPTRINGPINLVASEVPPGGAIAPTPLPTPGQPSPVPGSAPGLPDIVGHWAEPFIRGLVARRIISGFPDGTFKPELPMTRAQYAAIIATAFNLPAKRPNSFFVDVPNNFWAIAAIAKAEQMGFISGFPDGTFRPNQNLTRIHAIVSLVSGLGLAGGNPNSLNAYQDRVQIPSYAVNAVAIATQRRIIVNYPYPNRLDPLVEITRAQVAALLYQSLVAIGQAEGILSGYIIQANTSVPSFADLDNHWAIAFIRGLASQGFVSGFTDGTFKPDAPMTRAQFAVLLVNTFNPQFKRPAVAFKDVPADFWATAAIQRAYQGGLLSGFGDGTFQPNQSVSRIQVLLALVNGLELPPTAADLLNQYLNRYGDAADIPNYARDVVARATAQRIVVNAPQVNQLRPNQAATRAEVSAMVYQATVYLKRSPALESPFIVNPSA
jgi:parallel beta-helix repeat protein